MNQYVTGAIIKELREKKKITQLELAEKLGVSDKTVSKWETGKSLPDASIMLELCGLLKITVNDLLSGEVVSMNNYNEKSEKNLLEMIKQKEQADKRLLSLEIVIGLMSVMFLFLLIFIAQKIIFYK